MSRTARTPVEARKEIKAALDAQRTLAQKRAAFKLSRAEEIGYRRGFSQGVAQVVYAIREQVDVDELEEYRQRVMEWRVHLRIEPTAPDWLDWISRNPPPERPAPPDGKPTLEEQERELNAQGIYFHWWEAAK